VLAVPEMVTTLPELSTLGLLKAVSCSHHYRSDHANKTDHYDWSKPGVLETEVDGKPYGLGHFTQLVWKETTKIGCAAVTCDAGSLFEEVYGEVSYYSC
jgi:hypothetical protein